MKPWVYHPCPLSNRASWNSGDAGRKHFSAIDGVGQGSDRRRSQDAAAGSAIQRAHKRCIMELLIKFLLAGLALFLATLVFFVLLSAYFST